MQIRTDLLIQSLSEVTKRSSETVITFKKASIGSLNFKDKPESWSVLECIEHLNLYGDFYLPEIQKQLNINKGKGAAPIFKSGILGNYFANLMKVKNGNIKKMKSPKDKIPSDSNLNIKTIDRFLQQQELLESLLQRAEMVHLTKTKTAISLNNFIKLRLGDTLRFYVFHIERHVLQAERAFKRSQSKDLYR